MLALPAGIFAEVNPYAAIVRRNVFQLKAALPVPRVVVSPAPPPTITLLGIVAGNGPKQLLFKTPVGTPPREAKYILGESERADEIEVIQINVAAGLVQLRNRGLEQTLSLEKDGLKPGGAPPVGAPGTAAHSAAVGNAPPHHHEPSMTAEEQMIRMEINRKLTAEQVRKGLVPPLPVTPLTGN